MINQFAATNLNVCLHVTSADAVESILRNGLMPQVGPMSSQMETRSATFMFPSWDDMMDANWLWEDWIHESEPVLLCVDTHDLELKSEAGYEVVYLHNIAPDRITLIAPTEENWKEAKVVFEKMGGRIQSNFFNVRQREPK